MARDELGVGCVLSGDAIRAAIASPKPLLREFRNIDSQVQPNGFDLTLASIARHGGRGTVGESNADRELPELDRSAVRSRRMARASNPAAITLFTTKSWPYRSH